MICKPVNRYFEWRPPPTIRTELFCMTAGRITPSARLKIPAADGVVTAAPKGTMR